MAITQRLSSSANWPSRGGWSFDPKVAGIAGALICALPVMALVPMAIAGGGGHFGHLFETVLGTYSLNSVLLVAAAMIGTTFLAVPTAWLTARYEFAGRRLAMVLLPLPLAMPSYVAAYAWMSMSAAGGPLNVATGGMFPSISGVTGASFVFSLCFYPYVFLLARQAFASEGSHSFEAARILGAGPLRAFWKVALPIARPAIMAGLALVAMETLADYGTVDFLGSPTFTVGIIRAWISFGDPEAAARMALILVILTLAFFGFERWIRRRRSIAQAGGRHRPNPRVILQGQRGLLALLLCLIPVTLGLFAPVAHLLQLTLETSRQASPWSAVSGTLTVAALSALLAILIGVGAAYAARSGGTLARISVRIAHAGYAVPGAVAALGVIAILGAAQSLISGISWAASVTISGGGLLALLFAYQARFAAAAIGPCESAFQRITPSMDQAARSLGASRFEVIRRIHLPLASSGMITAAALVFIEVMKELPATMILRPLDFETLAISAHHFASDERLAQAALPSLILVGLGVPVMLLIGWLSERGQP
ncbi:iron ABC transporter permease [Pontixanthobacter aestiaquae]|uniref:ABC transporter permease subunit n=1 Tax=Pontixanthobacter aestiaquae TaxID=1509367 RepID=A0A844Z3T7_9SPHN|nr:iron ABC transporter permease [Pontixanthobacter aestiaquae]MDN3647267.1 iron ABC transporter permease [Pontixanthobacter aestiaquae]MXO81757.1 ABC transporter permease subunit [Pontixanthobacter aestiaquae]